MLGGDDKLSALNQPTHGGDMRVKPELAAIFLGQFALVNLDVAIVAHKGDSRIRSLEAKALPVNLRVGVRRDDRLVVRPAAAKAARGQPCKV